MPVKYVSDHFSIAAHHGGFNYDDKLIDTIAARWAEVDSGAHHIDNSLSGSLLPEVAGEVLERMGHSEPVKAINASVGENGKFAYALERTRAAVSDSTSLKGGMPCHND
ncbi:hypothetical protein [Rhodanobacter sp. L36]|uniref:hypothetical protein n=1 Tax=Rhodanobacter sp. L36 TaxID=1747221 RepID=UPI00131AC116|nr:hypothetical protein [Rhodanobacter sp. L36]